MLYHKNGILGDLSVIGIGCWNFGGQWANKVSESEAISIIRHAIDNGVNFVDVAESYGIPDGQCEILLGKALKGGYRERVKVVSKVGWWGRRTSDHFYAKDTLIDKYAKKILNKLYHTKTIDLNHRTSDLIRLSGHACCGRLQTDFIDLLLCHDGSGRDMNSFIEAFRALKHEGFILHYGISTDDIEVLKTFYKLSNGECAACEFDYSLLNRSAEKEIIPFCKKNNITMLVRGALASGILSGKYNLDTTFTEPSRLCWNKGGIRRAEYEYKINLLNKLTSAVNMNGAKVAYPFVFSNPNHLSVVMGVTSMMQLKENLDVESLYMDNDNYQYIAGIKC